MFWGFSNKLNLYLWLWSFCVYPKHMVLNVYHYARTARDYLPGWNTGEVTIVNHLMLWMQLFKISWGSVLQGRAWMLLHLHVIYNGFFKENFSFPRYIKRRHNIKMIWNPGRMKCYNAKLTCGWVILMQTACYTIYCIYTTSRLTYQSLFLRWNKKRPPERTNNYLHERRNLLILTSRRIL